MTMMGKRLIIGQINARRSPPVMEILGRVFNERKIDILLIQEPPLALVRREWSFPGYRIYVASGPNPLTAIMVNVSLASSAVELEGDRVCGAVVNTHLGKLWLFSAYIRYLTGAGLDQLSSGFGTRRFCIEPSLCGHGLQWAFAPVGSQHSAVGSSGSDG